jgi:hypothetical protein
VGIIPLLHKAWDLWKKCTGHKIYLSLFSTYSVSNVKYLVSQSLWQLACWDCRFESCQGHGCLSVVSVVRCHIDVSATDRSFVQRGPTERACVTACDLEASTRRPRHTRAGQEPVRLFASCVLAPFVLPASVSGAFGLAGVYWWTLANLSLYNRAVHMKLSSAVETSLVSWLLAAIAMINIRDMQFAVTHTKHDFSSARLFNNSDSCWHSYNDYVLTDFNLIPQLARPMWLHKFHPPYILPTHSHTHTQTLTLVILYVCVCVCEREIGRDSESVLFNDVNCKHCYRGIRIMNMGNRWSDIDRGKPKYPEENLSQCQSDRG